MIQVRVSRLLLRISVHVAVLEMLGQVESQVLSRHTINLIIVIGGSAVELKGKQVSLRLV